MITLGGGMITVGSGRHNVRVAAGCLVAAVAAAGLLAGPANSSSEGMPSFRLAGNPGSRASPVGPGPGKAALMAAANLVRERAAALARSKQQVSAVSAVLTGLQTQAAADYEAEEALGPMAVMFGGAGGPGAYLNALGVEQVLASHRTDTLAFDRAGSAVAQGNTAADWALTQIGKPYQWGAAGPGTYDCSGLAMDAWARAGIQLRHYTGWQWPSGPHVPVSQLRRGDLVFYATNTADPSTIHHVGIFIGGGMMVDAPFTGAFVRIDSIYRFSGLIGATRPAN